MDEGDCVVRTRLNPIADVPLLVENSLKKFETVAPWIISPELVCFAETSNPTWRTGVAVSSFLLWYLSCTATVNSLGSHDPSCKFSYEDSNAATRASLEMLATSCANVM